MLTAGNIRIVIVDDDEDDYFILSDYIKDIEGSNFKIDWCNNYDKAISLINARKYDIYFVDYRLGSSTGLDLLQAVRAQELDDPIVLLTGKGNMDIDRKAMKYGATDYVVKSELNSEKLERCIRYSLDRAKDLRELRLQERKYRTLFESSKDAIFIADEQLQFVEVNEAASKLFGSLIGNSTKRNLYNFMRDESARARLCEEVNARKNVHDMEIEIRNKSNEIRSCLLSIAFPVDMDATPLVHGILHDITSIKKAEMINLQSQKLAANERLMRTLAHEIRNPLNNIGLSVDHFQLPMEKNATNENLVSIVQRNCIRINHIITELLNITNKPLDLSFETHSLQDIMDESISMTLDRINLQKIKLNKHYPDTPLHISANKSKLAIAFTNIIINAIEAMDPGKGELKITLSTAPGQHLVSIEDNGEGIPSEYMQKLFEPFFTSKKNGTGLGLAACNAIIRSHKGDIKVESEVSKGTQFQISFERNN